MNELQEEGSIDNILTLSSWNLTLDSYEPGGKITRTEENEDTGVTTTEAAKTNSGKIEFQADSFQGGTAAIWINGTKVPVNMDRRTADLTAYVQLSENTITVRVTSSLRNIMITQNYDGWIFGTPDSDDYGMTGETKLVYTK